MRLGGIDGVKDGPNINQGITLMKYILQSLANLLVALLLLRFSHW